MTDEEWGAIPGWEDSYRVSKTGNVESLTRTIVRSNGTTQAIKGRILSAPPSTFGYPVVTLWRGNKGVTRTVHSLVAEAFLGPRPEGMEVCHGDKGPGVPDLSNLRYDTHQENLMDTIRAGTNSKVTEVCSRGHSKTGGNRISYGPFGTRSKCRACARENGLSRKQHRPFDFERADANYWKIMKENK